MLMTNLKMDPPAPQKRAMSRKHVLGSKLQGSQLQTGDQTSDFLGPDTQAVDDWWTEKNHTSGSSCSASSTLESLMCLETSVQSLGSFFQLQSQRADAVCMCVCEQGSESGHRWEAFMPHGEERVEGQTFLEEGRNYTHLQRQERIVCLGWSKWVKSLGGYCMLGWGTGGHCGENVRET